MKQNEKKLFSWSKCIKVNETDLYVIGDDNTTNQLIHRDLNLMKGCLQINTVTGKVVQRAEMNNCRRGFGIQTARQYLYVVGGQDETSKVS